MGKLTLQSAHPERDFKDLDGDLKEAIGAPVAMLVKSTHAVLELPLDQLDAARSAVAHLRPQVKVMSSGENIEIFKEVGLPKDVASRFEVAKMGGTHGIGHTRMATESAVTTMGAHPFSTGLTEARDRLRDRRSTDPHPLVELVAFRAQLDKLQAGAEKRLAIERRKKQ